VVRVPDAGTLGYASPEQVHGNYDELDPRSDVYSLGAILYEMLAGQDPFPEPDDSEKLRRSLQGEVEPLDSVLWYHLPSRLPRIAMEALSSDPANRHQSVLELKEDVELFLISGWNFERRTYPAGSYITREGDPGTEAFVIVEGRCEVLQTVDGAECLQRRMRNGDVFGETAVFTDEIRTASVRAVGDVTVAVVKGGDFEEKLGMGFWLGLFVKALAGRFKEKDARANNLERDLLESDVANAALKHLLVSGAATSDGGREAPLAPILDLLTTRFDKNKQDILTVLKQLDDVSVLGDRIVFTRS